MLWRYRTALAGNSDEAIAHLEAAFALRPENRIHARRDEDFQGLSADPRFRRLIYPAGILRHFRSALPAMPAHRKDSF